MSFENGKIEQNANETQYVDVGLSHWEQDSRIDAKIRRQKKKIKRARRKAHKRGKNSVRYKKKLRKLERRYQKLKKERQKQQTRNSEQLFEQKLALAKAQMEVFLYQQWLAMCGAENPALAGKIKAMGLPILPKGEKRDGTEIDFI